VPRPPRRTRRHTPRVGGGTQFETSEFEYGRPGPRNNGDIDGPHGMRANGRTTAGHAFRQELLLSFEAANYPRDCRRCQLSSG
jgi:hypothetical protein